MSVVLFQEHLKQRLRLLVLKIRKHPLLHHLLMSPFLSQYYKSVFQADHVWLAVSTTPPLFLLYAPTLLLQPI